MSARTYIATVTFWCHGEDNKPHLIHEGSKFPEGHPALDGRIDLFREEETKPTPVKRSPGRPRKD